MVYNKVKRGHTMNEDLYLLWVVDENNRTLFRNMMNSDDYNPIYDQLLRTIKTTRITNTRQLYSAMFKLEQKDIAGICLCEPSKENPNIILASFHYDPNLEKIMLGMFDQLPDFVMILNESLHPVHISKAWIDLLEIDKDEMTLEHFESFINASAPNTHATIVQEAIKNRIPLDKETLGFFTKEKQTVFLELSGVPFNNAQGLLLYSIVARRVDDQYETNLNMNNQLTQMAQMVELQNKQLRLANEQLINRVTEQSLIQTITQRFIRINIHNTPVLLMKSLDNIKNYFHCSSVAIVTLEEPHVPLEPKYIRFTQSQSNELQQFRQSINSSFKKQNYLSLTKESHPMIMDKYLLILPIFQKSYVTHWLWLESPNHIDYFQYKEVLTTLLHLLSSIMVRFRKMSELYQSEKQNQIMLDFSPISNIMYNLRTSEAIASNAFFTLTGYTKEDLQNHAYLIDLQKMLKKLIISQNKSYDSIELDFMLANGSFLPIYLTYYHNNVDDLVFMSFVDMSEQKKKEEQLKQSYQRIGNLLDQTLMSLSNIVDVVDPYNSAHQYGVAKLAKDIAIAAQLSNDDCEAIYYAGLLHDIGKLHVPTEILNKPAKLNPIEYQLVQTHSTYSYEILKHIEFPWPIADIVLHHHEKKDGSGYPSGLQGEEIPVLSRILAIADTIESMATHKPYRNAFSKEFIIQELHEFSHHYDDTFLTHALHLLDKIDLDEYLKR